MAQKSQYNPKDAVSVVSFMESLNTPKKLLENSMKIYGTDSDIRRASIENVVRYEDLTMEQLSEENHKLNSVMTAAIENNIPLTEAHQTFLVNMSKLVKTRIGQVNDPAYHNRKLMVNVLENQLGINSDIKYVSESVNPFGDALTENLVTMGNHPEITSRGLFEAANAICSPMSTLSADMKDNLKSGLIDKVKTTLKVECKDNRCYSDLPIIQALDNTREVMRDTFADKDIEEEIDTLFDDIEDSLSEIFEEYVMEFASDFGFKPDPFSVYNLVPFSVGSRTVTRSMNALINAETDEEITEALIDFGKMYAFCEAYGEDVLMERLDKTKEVTRKMANKSGQVVDKIKSVKKDTDEVKDNLKRTVDPMDKFVEDTFLKFKKADQEERRNLIIKGGVVNKLRRYITRSIVAFAAGTAVGTPILGTLATAITLLASIAHDKHADAKEKNRIINELEDELELVEEKIEDSKGDDDKSKKYELMRIRAKLKKELDRVQMGLKY